MTVAAHVWANDEEAKRKAQFMAQASAKLEAAEAWLKAEEERTKAADVSYKGIYMPGFDDPAAAAEAWAKEYRAKQKAREQEQLIDPYELIAGVL